ncbi:MAG: universal stress protein [Bacteroidota bacterium]
MKKILIALDYDPSAQKVAEKGFILAQSMNAEVILLHVICDPSCSALFEHVTIVGFANHETPDVPIKSSDETLIEKSLLFLEKYKQHLKDKDIQLMVKEGDVADEILKIAKSLKIDLIIMGSQSHRQLEKVIVGSSTEKVLSMTSIPLLIIPTK